MPVMGARHTSEETSSLPFWEVLTGVHHTPSWQQGQLSEEYHLGLHQSPSTFSLFNLGQDTAHLWPDYPLIWRHSENVRCHTIMMGEPSWT